jgi:hypothetical protein
MTSHAVPERPFTARIVGDGFVMPTLKIKSGIRACFRPEQKAARHKVEFLRMTFEATLLSVWRQSLVENSKVVVLGGESFPVLKTSKMRLKQITFEFDGRTIRGIEQNPVTKSRWAKMVRDGKKVMQFLEGGRYVAVVVDGKVKTYG